MKTPTIQEFLEARLSEEHDRLTDPIVCMSPWPSREILLADIAAKREILDDYRSAIEVCEGVDRGEVAADIEGRERAEVEREILRRPVAHLASAYRDHPDWRADW